MFFIVSFSREEHIPSHAMRVLDKDQTKVVAMSWQHAGCGIRGGQFARWSVATCQPFETSAQEQEQVVAKIVRGLVRRW
jgi:hypothetical protein